MGMENPMTIEDIIEKKIEKHHHEACGPGLGLQGTNGIAAIGIVVAVLGVIKTVISINEPPAVLGAMIGGALVVHSRGTWPCAWSGRWLRKICT